MVEPDLSRVCLVDNSPASYAINQGDLGSASFTEAGTDESSIVQPTEFPSRDGLTTRRTNACSTSCLCSTPSVSQTTSVESLDSEDLARVVEASRS